MLLKDIFEAILPVMTDGKVSWYVSVHHTAMKSYTVIGAGR